MELKIEYVDIDSIKPYEVTLGDSLFYKYSIELKKLIYKKSYGNERHRPSL